MNIYVLHIFQYIVFNRGNTFIGKASVFFIIIFYYVSHDVFQCQVYIFHICSSGQIHTEKVQVRSKRILPTRPLGSGL